MRVWRLMKAEHAPGLDGEGARRFGGRWNSAGRPMVYCASSLALATLEVFVHMPPAMRTAAKLPPLVAVALIVPDDSPGAVEDTLPTDESESRAIGDGFLTRDLLWLSVPSAVIRQERNLLLNPLHLAMAEVRVERQEPFSIDLRLLP